MKIFKIKKYQMKLKIFKSKQKKKKKKNNLVNLKIKKKNFLKKQKLIINFIMK